MECSESKAIVQHTVKNVLLVECSRQCIEKVVYSIYRPCNTSCGAEMHLMLSVYASLNPRSWARSFLLHY